MRTKRSQIGVSLVELLLVIVIVSVMTIMAVLYVQQRAQDARIDRTVLEVQQILKAAQAFYAANGRWPDGVSHSASDGSVKVLTSSNQSELQTQGYLPNRAMRSALGVNTPANISALCQPVQPPPPVCDCATLRGTSTLYCHPIVGGVTQNIRCTDALPPVPLTGNCGITIPPASSSSLETSPMLGVSPYYTIASWNGDARIMPANSFMVAFGLAQNTKMETLYSIVAGRFPFSKVVGGVAYVTIPVPPMVAATNTDTLNFAGNYSHGACVPVPQCPLKYDPATDTKTTLTPQIFVFPVSVSGVNDAPSKNVYPISSFSAYAMPAPGNPPRDCSSGGLVPSTSTTCTDTSQVPASGLYWRVCLQIVTGRGDVQLTTTDTWGNQVIVGAFTRCATQDEPVGSGFSVFTH